MQQALQTFGNAVEELFFDSMLIKDGRHTVRCSIRDVNFVSIALSQQCVYVYLNVHLKYTNKIKVEYVSTRILITFEYLSDEGDEMLIYNVTNNDDDDFYIVECVDVYELMQLYHNIREEEKKMVSTLLPILPQDVITNHLLPFLEYEIADNLAVAPVVTMNKTEPLYRLCWW